MSEDVQQQSMTRQALRDWRIARAERWLQVRKERAAALGQRGEPTEYDAIIFDLLVELRASF